MSIRERIMNALIEFDCNCGAPSSRPRRIFAGEAELAEMTEFIRREMAMHHWAVDVRLAQFAGMEIVPVALSNFLCVGI